MRRTSFMTSSTRHFHDTSSPSLKGAYLHGERGGGEGALQADRQPGDSHRRTGALEPQTGQAASPGQHEEHRERRHCQVGEANTLCPHLRRINACFATWSATCSPQFSQSGSYFSRTGSGPLKKKAVRPGSKVCVNNNRYF